MVRKILNAFTLLELSIVLVIMVILTSMSIDFSGRFLEQNRLNNTQLKLRKIQDALNAYLIQNGKLPCPAGLKKSTGVAASSCDTTNSTDGIFIKDSVAKGWVPYETLDLTADVVYDSWGNKITYMVTNSAVTDFYKIANNANGIKVYDTVESETPITNSAIYAIISHGKNGLGAYNKDDTQNSIANISNSEKINSPIQLSSHENNVLIYFSKLGKNKDDIAIYSTKIQTAIDNDLENISSYIDSTVVNNLLSTYGLSSSDVEFTIPSNNFLQYGDYIVSSNERFKIKSYKYGKLELVDQLMLDDDNNLEKKCNKASLLSNNAIFTSIVGYANVGESISFKCDTCSNASKTNLFATCRSGGLWFYNGSCITKTCNKSSLSYSHVTFTDKSGVLGCNESITKNCDIGYEGSVTATCNSNNNWVYTGSCTIKTCQNSQLSFANATFTNKTGTTNYNQTQTANCNIGYTGGPITATCQDTKTWDYTGNCVSKTCQNSQLSFANATFTNKTGITNYNQTQTGNCNIGYAGGPITATCQNVNTWSYTGSCTIKTCQNSQLSFANATFTNKTGTTNYNQTQTANCNIGYYGGPITATCQADQTWHYTGACYESGSITFNYTGSQQTWTVPTGLNSVKVQVWGAQGGGIKGGKGGYSEGILPVTGGNTIYVNVGGRPSNQTGGWNGGGATAGGTCAAGGGGATDVRYGGTALSNRKIVAGGGGGIGSSTGFGGYGGGANNSGGNGGKFYGYAGTGGTSSAGGTYTASSCSSGSTFVNGALGLGGYSTAVGCGGGGGGGGGGYYGGGPGTVDGSSCDDSGGGGGSGYIGGVTNGNGSNDVQSGNGLARICWGDNTDCDVAMCDRSTLQTVANGSYDKTGFAIQDQVLTATCNTGYRGTVTATCTSNGTWTYNNGTCGIVTCNKSTLNSSGYIFTDKTGTVNYGEKVYGTCNTGYNTASYTPYAICTSNSMTNVTGWYGWNYYGCTIKTCQNSQLSFANATFTTTTGTTNYNTTRTGTCNTGYYGGPITATCQADQTWRYTGACYESGSITFNYTGSMQTWTIPEYMTSIKIQVLGASGGSNNTLTNNGVELKSGGGCAYGTLNLNNNTLNVKAGDTLYINVGASGGTTHHGGQATDVRINNTSSLTCNSNDPRIIVAGGGGGTGVSINSTFYKDKIYAGGGGGGSGNGSDGSAFDSGAEGGGGTQSSGGAGGFHDDAGGNYQANSGQCGFGGAAYPHSNNYYGDGGDGWYGGGGASGGGSGGSGGGGSAHFVSLSNTGGLNGARFGNGLARICWGNNTDCDTCQVPQCQNSQLSFTNATFENTAGTTNINQTQTGTCNTGYFGSITAMCTANGWSYIGSCYESGSITFNYTGSQQTWTVPENITNIKIQVFGAEGGTSSTGSVSSIGGYGGYAYGTLTVSPNDTIYVYVGGKGSNVSGSNTRTGGDGGWNGGGKGGGSSWAGGGAGAGGGGATDIRYGGTALSNRKIVAGGGGGGAKSDNINYGYGGSGNNQDGKESFPFHGVDEEPLCAMGGGKSGANGGGAGTICSNSSYCHIAGNSGTSGIGGSGSSGSGYFGGGGGGGGYIGGGAGTSGGCTGSYMSGGGGGSGSAYTSGVSDGLTINATSIGNGLARICWGDNTDCNTPTCNKSEINYENAFGSLTGTVTIGSSISSSCKSGYLGTITALCTNAGWKYRGNCILSATSCDRNTLRSSGDNIITSSPGVPGSKFHPGYESVVTSGETTNDLRYFANGSMFDAYCDTEYDETNTGGQIDITWGDHAYKCVNGEWKRIGTCVPKPSGSITFNYTGSQQTWTVPNGVTSLKILAFGAKGGGDNCGYGGYSRGILTVSSGQTIYITVGGSGSCSSSGGSSTAGYNGGGYDATDGCGTNGGHGCGGGGATHIAKTSGLLKNLSSSNVLLVAGGGGGKSESSNCGGAGGGANSNGSDGNGEWKGFGGTVSGGGSGNNGNASGTFGLGGNVTRRSTTKAKWCGGAGGGGYYGGGAGEWASKSDAGGGGGGSGFCGNGMQSCSGSNGYNNGDGMARICWGNNTDCD